MGTRGEWRALDLARLPGRYAVCRLRADAPVPAWATTGVLAGVMRTTEELSVVCPEESVPRGVRHESGWRALRVVGPLDFAETGVLASIASPLARAGVSLFAISTFDTDYVLVREKDLARALVALQAAGHRIAEE